MLMFHLLLITILKKNRDVSLMIKYSSNGAGEQLERKNILNGINQKGVSKIIVS